MTRNPLHICFISMGAWAHFADAYGLGRYGQRYAPGGAELQARLLAEELARRPGVRASVVTADFGQPERVRCGGVTLWRGPKPPYTAPPRELAAGTVWLWRLLDRIRPDLVVDQTASPRPAVLARWARRRARKFVFLSAHDDDCSGAWERQTNPLFAAMYRRGIQQADIVMLQTEQQRELLLRRHGRDAPVLTTIARVPRGEAVPPEREFVLWAGRCVAIKRPLAFLRLAKRLPQERFRMIAPAAAGQEKLRRRLEERVAGFSNVELLDRTPHDEMLRTYRRAKVFVSTSAGEGWPNVYLEAAAAGTPVAALRFDPDGLVEKHGWGTNARGDEERLARDVERFCTNPGARAGAGRAGREYVAQWHSRERAADQFLDALAGE